MQLEEIAFEALEILANVVCLGVFLAMIFAVAIGVK
jgi:hypothetical protein